MGDKKVKICKVFKCSKEVHAPKAMFCGEHERNYRETREMLGIGILLLGGIVLKKAFTGNRNKDKS